MQSEKAVEVDRALGCTERFSESDGTRNRNARPEIVIGFLSVGHDDIQSVRRTALKEANQRFALRYGCEVHTERGTTEKAGRESQCYESESARFYEYSALHICLVCYRRWNSGEPSARPTICATPESWGTGPRPRACCIARVPRPPPSSLRLIPGRAS